MSKNEVPAAVVDAAKNRAYFGSGEIILIGRLNDSDVYSYKFYDTVTLGMPELYLWNGHSVTVMYGSEAEDALVLISSFS